MIKRVFFLIFLFFLTACSSQPMVFAYQVDPSFTAIATDIPTSTPSPVPTNSSSPNPAPTQEGTPTPAPTPAPSPTYTLAPQTRWNPPGSIIAPVLLYHHVAESNPPLRYYVPPAEFVRQMEMLKEKGYRTISMSTLQDAFTSGAEIPLHPMVITFDDGALDVYTTAFPVMQKLGFTGTLYIPGKYLNGEGFVTTDMVKELVAAGWQIGSHSMTHDDLTKSDDTIKEINGSRAYLEGKLGTPINSFAYPFGAFNEAIVNTMKKSGYHNAVGLGFYSENAPKNQFYISRMEIKHSTNIEKFEKMITTLTLLDGSTISYLDAR